MTTRREFLQSIADTTADYRAGDLAKPTPHHVDLWVKQFSAEAQLPILREMDLVLKKTYFSFERVSRFLKGLLGAQKLVGTDPCAFWRSVRFLDIQGGGNSQSEMLGLFGHLLEEECGIKPEDREGNQDSKVFIYLDDAIFSGNRVRRDLETWLGTDAPDRAEVHVISIALHSGGQFYANGRVQATAKAAKKEVSVTWWREIVLEDRLFYTNQSDVLRPTGIPEAADVKRYIDEMTRKPHLRVAGHPGTSALFSGEPGRHLIEQEFLRAGVRVRGMCPNLGVSQRPLGHSTLETLGFGSLIVTFRNCPNNAPLAFWAGDPWYPLFARTTNTATAHKRLMATLAVKRTDAR